MKITGNILLTVSLIAAMLSAATAYLVPATLPDEAFQGQTDGGVEYARLASSAGVKPIGDVELQELRRKYETGEMTAEAYARARQTAAPLVQARPSIPAPAESAQESESASIETAAEQAIHYTAEDEGGALLTPQRLAVLRAAGGNAIHVSKFAFERWKYWWVFALSAAGLFAGSMLVRYGTKAEIAAAATAAKRTGGAEVVVTPEQSFEAIVDAVASLQRDLPGMASERDRLDAIIQRLGEAQKTSVFAFIDARPLLVNRMGLGGYSELMDHFAAAERQINRAWSAAADGVYDEARACIDSAAILLERTRPKLRA